MWYGTSNTQTGLATSSDGLSWTDQGVVMTDGYHATVEYYSTGFPGSNTGTNPSSSTMYYRMWYWDYSTIYDPSSIGYTESPDGETWYNYQSCQNGTVAIVTGNSSDWNYGSYGPSDILYNPSASNTGTDWTFTMYFDGSSGGTQSLGLAFSSDGITWTGYDADSDGNADPALAGTGNLGDWDEDYVARATIIKNADDDYEMWYSGGIGAMNNGIGYATSSDGINWTRDPGNPIIHRSDTGYPGEPWRGDRTYCPAVIRQPTAYKMWFAGRTSGGNYAIGYMEETPTAVNLTRFEAIPQDNAIRLEWETATELDNLGFNLYRSESASGARMMLNNNLIPAQAPGSTVGAAYAWLDQTVSAAPGIYYYWLEDLDVYGNTTLHGPVSAEVQPLRRLLPSRPRLAPGDPIRIKR